MALFTQNAPRRWNGLVRRLTLARAIQGSNSIEGYHATVEEALNVVEDEPVDERTEAWFALTGYRRALTYVMQAAQDPSFEFDKQFIKSVHFMMLDYDMSKHPGQWRPGAIWIESSETGERVYEAPERERLEVLIGELCTYIGEATRQHLLVKAAMVHLNLTLIHPFSDGNGRMARAMQTLLLARDGLIHPIFSSVEEWLGAHTNEYYAVLAQVAGGGWSPASSAHPWLRFCLKAHYQQAATLLRRMDEYDALYPEVERVVARRKLSARVVLPLFDAAIGATLTNARYQELADVSSGIATRDLRMLSDLGLLDASGETRARRYRRGNELSGLRRRTRISKALPNPYDLIEPRRLPVTK